MKSCTKCGSDLPDSAQHCVFCGARHGAGEPAQQAAAPDGKKSRTMMGYPGMAADVLKKAQQQREAGVTPEPVYSDTDEVPTPRKRLGPHDGPGEGPHKAPPAAHEKATMALSPDNSPDLGGPPPPAGAGSGQGLGKSTAFAPAGGNYGAPPPMTDDRSGPVPGPHGGDGSAPAPLPGFAHGQQPYGAPPPGMNGLGGGPGGPPPGMGHGPGGPPPGTGHPPAHQIQPQSAPPPYLASQTDERHFAPEEPWEQSLKTLLLVFGVLLAACFVAPWAVVGGKATFSWSLLSADGLTAKLQPLLLVGSAVLAVVFALVPLTMKARGLAAGLIGFAGVHTLTIIQFAQTVGDAFSVQLLVNALTSLLATLTLIPGLLLRSQYRSATLPRVLTTVGVLCVLAPLLIPGEGRLPLIQFVDGAFSAPVQIDTLVMLLYLVLAVASLLVWLPPSSGAGASILAWLFILQPVIASGAINFGEGLDFTVIKSGLAQIFYLPLAALGWLALAGHGIAAFFGKGLEQP